jgi:hypothetical protein
MLHTFILHTNGAVLLILQSLPVGVSDPGDPQLCRSVNFVAACPRPDGLAQDGIQGGNAACIISHRGDARSRGYKRRARERDPVHLLVPHAAPPPPAGRPGAGRGGVRGGVLEPCVRDNVAVREVPEPCRSTAGGAAGILLTSPCFCRRLRAIRCQGRTRGTIITCYRSNLRWDAGLVPS